MNLAKTKMTGGVIKAGQPLYSRILWLCRRPNFGDVDNIVKPILDALKGIVFDDDALISQSLVTRIDPRHAYEIVDAGEPNEPFQELIDLLSMKLDDIIYVEVGRISSQRLVFGTIDGGTP